MKRLLVICLFVLYAAVWADRIHGQNSNRRASAAASTADIPFVTGVDHREAPSGAVIQLKIQSGVPDAASLSKYRLAIGGVTAQFYPIYKDDKDTIAAVVPYNIKPPPDAKTGTSFPIEIIFFDPQEHGGIVYNQFSVLIPTGLGGKAVEISGIKERTGNDFDITFNDYIPPELWPKVKIYFDDRPVERIVKMDERLFIVELPIGVSSTKFDVFARVGESETSLFKYDRFAPPQTPTPSLTPTPATQVLASPEPTILTMLSIVAALMGMVLAIYFYRRSKLNALATLPVSPSENVEELHLPEGLPSDLVEACAAGDCVLYAGAGLSAQSGLPTWKDFVLGLLQWAIENKFIDEAEAASFRAEIARGQTDPVADSIVSRLVAENDKALLHEHLRKVFLKRSSPSAFHSQLKSIRFSAVLTTNFDNLLEGVYETQPSQVYTPGNTESLLAALTKRDFFILKLYGTLDKPDTVMVAPAQYEDAITGNRLFSQFMQTLFLSRSLLFVGASLEGIESYLRGISFPKGIVLKHYALVAVKDIAWRAKADLLERRYGIKVLPYTPVDNYAELGEFLRKLTEAVAARPNAAADGKRVTSSLKRLALKNIGPFDNLELNFDLKKSEHKWHIFLGDNGVGKSTVLKAIAFALCGEKAQPYAARLLKGGRNEGKITLETSGTSYVTAIERKRNGEVVIVGSEQQALPLEAEGWLAVGFPPLRTTSWEPPKGPDVEFKIKSRPVIDDLLPLVKGDVDPRLDKLKQWIINLDYQAEKSKNREGHYNGLIQKVFDILGSVAEGMKLNYKGVDEWNRILIETDDGASIPLEALSQGTISLMGWIGILMQRLYEVFDQDEDPTQRYALILMDEIDAHMHPRWQRTLVNHLKDTFPKAQFIATTHSPLVVGGMPAEQVVRFARDEQGKAVILPIAPDMTLGYTDQILTSPLFDLPTTTDDTTKRTMSDYRRLDEMKNRSVQEEEEYEELRQELMVRVAPMSGSYDKKHEEMLSKAKLLKEAGEKLRELSPEGGDILLARADKMLSNLEGGDDNDSN